MRRTGAKSEWVYIPLYLLNAVEEDANRATDENVKSGKEGIGRGERIRTSGLLVPNQAL